MPLVKKKKEELITQLKGLELEGKVSIAELAKQVESIGNRLKLLVWLEETKAHKSVKRKEFFQTLFSGKYPRFTEAWLKGTELGLSLYPDGLEKLLKCWDDTLVPYISRMEQAKELDYIVRDPERTKFWFKVGDELDSFAVNSTLFSAVNHERALRNIDISLGVLL